MLCFALDGGSDGVDEHLQSIEPPRLITPVGPNARQLLQQQDFDMSSSVTASGNSSLIRFVFDIIYDLVAGHIVVGVLLATLINGMNVLQRGARPALSMHGCRHGRQKIQWTCVKVSGSERRGS